MIEQNGKRKDNDPPLGWKQYSERSWRESNGILYGNKPDSAER